MSDSIAGAAAWLGGTEIVNDSRTTAYLSNGIKPSTLNVFGDCGCSNILALAGCDDEYTTPAQDDAPWYDPAIPESAEFAGFLSTSFEGLSSTYTRSVTESISDGATLGRSRFGSRSMTWKGFLFGSSCCGVAYGLRWLGKTLQGDKNCGNNCFGDDLEILVCCPTIEAAQGLSSNLLCNGDFDSSTYSWRGSGNTAITWTSSTFYGDDHRGSLVVSNPLGGAMTFNIDNSVCIIQVSGSKSYKLSLRAKGATGTTASFISVNFNWYDILGNLISTTAAPNIGMDNSQTWELITASVSSPANATSVRLDFTTGGISTPANELHYIDSVQLNQTNFAPIVDPFRTIKGVALLEGPIIQSERKMGSTCGGRCGGATAIEIEFTLIGSQPWLYSAPIPVVNCVPLNGNSVTMIGRPLSGTINPGIDSFAVSISSTGFASLPTIFSSDDYFYITLDPTGSSFVGIQEVVLVTAHDPGSTTITVIRGQLGTGASAHAINSLWIKDTDNCPAPDCGFDVLANLGVCDVPALPPTAGYTGCTVPLLYNYQAVYITAPRTLWNSLSEVVPVITIQTGGLPLLGSRIGFYSSADGNPCGSLLGSSPNCDVVCDTLSIITVPSNSKLYIDGRTNKISLICGTNAAFAGERYTLGPFSWPSFDCYGFCMEFAYDPLSAQEACISLSLVPRTTL